MTAASQHRWTPRCTASPAALTRVGSQVSTLQLLPHAALKLRRRARTTMSVPLSASAAVRYAGRSTRVRSIAAPLSCRDPRGHGSTHDAFAFPNSGSQQGSLLRKNAGSQHGSCCHGEECDSGGRTPSFACTSATVVMVRDRQRWSHAVFSLQRRRLLPWRGMPSRDLDLKQCWSLGRWSSHDGREILKGKRTEQDELTEEIRLGMRALGGPPHDTCHAQEVVCAKENSSG